MYGTYLNARRKLELLVLFFLIVFAASSTLTDAWLMWLVWIMLLLVLIAVDTRLADRLADLLANLFLQLRLGQLLVLKLARLGLQRRARLRIEHHAAEGLDEGSVPHHVKVPHDCAGRV